MSATAKRLWAISDELYEIGALIADGGGELTEELEARLNAIEGAFEDKVESVALFIRECELAAENAKAEKDRLAAIQASRESTARRLKSYLLACLSAANVRRVETHRARVRIQRSGTPSIDYSGELNALPERFVRVVPESRSVDKSALTQAVRAKEELPEGVRVTYSESLRIS